MAINDQCLKCKFYAKTGVCAKTNTPPVYNSSSCPNYEKEGINLGKDNGPTSPVPAVPYTPATQPNVDSLPSSVQPTPSAGDPKGKTNYPSFTFASLFSFEGRIRRTRYWLVNFGAALLMLPANLSGYGMSDGIAMFTLLMVIPSFWISLANVVKRFHDCGMSGWYALTLCVPLINICFCAYIAFFKGEQCDNQYGPNPY